MPKNVINDLKKSDTWKIQLTIAINFMYSKDNDEQRVIYSKSDNIEIMGNGKADEDIEKIFQTLCSSYQIRLETSIKSSDLYLIVFIYCITNVIK